MSAADRGPLSGLRVVDMSTTLMGPYCGLLLAQLGADVIKVERPGGDIVRDISDRSGHGLGDFYLNFNRGKRSVVLDVSNDADAAILREMIADADVFSHNLRPASARKLGLSYDSLASSNPGLVYCSMHGFDQRGPWRDKPAYDDTIQAAAGIAAMQGGTTGAPPMYVKSPIADKTVGVFAVIGVLTALYERASSGLGQEVSVPMYETMVAFTAMDQQGGTVFDPPLGPKGYARMESPHRRPYQTADGYIAVMVYTDRQWASFFTLIERPDLLADDRLLTIGGRTENIDELYALVAEVLPTRTTEDWLHILDSLDIPAAPVMSIDEVVKTPQSIASGVFESVDHPVLGLLRQPGMPVTFGRTPPAPAGPAVLLGADSAAIRDHYDHKSGAQR
ncbi:CaiB/BaiF CoA transferase family protein [Saccharopolyspora spinosa]|uniref:Crotonobetainyl-CoA:carnitine CoA-transferase CaiB-like acyl-CoA transferase n=1 Tax=Saccharopolyspora spinosa TaxID=60894 RepID=A0A2N3XXQ8_SACSN|nr:CoA transferase [Saccharopolyspora spinosa]PKW15454.1 crotonobetainyl-CoA:carnitine CoA-transferase CaiB-like acyl-CoA transferase [Saccharopolyspora spinosa]